MEDEGVEIGERLTGRRSMWLCVRKELPGKCRLWVVFVPGDSRFR